LSSSSGEAPIILSFHCEDESWWVDSNSLPSLFAGGSTLDEARELAHQVVAEEAGPDAWIVEFMPLPAPLGFVTVGEREAMSSVRTTVKPGDWSVALDVAKETEAPV